MSGRVRFKGRFAKEKKRDKEVKAIAAMWKANANKRQLSNDEENLLEQFVFEGSRIIDLDYFSKNLKCIMCKSDIFLTNTKRETRMGLHSIFHISCEKCSAMTEVSTGKTHTTSTNTKHADVNTKAVLGAVHSGIGEIGLNKFLACLNIPPMSSTMYKRYERDIGPAIEAAAKESCRKAPEEERELVIVNVQKLSQEL